MVALTIGMAAYDDFDGVYFTLQALRMYQDLADTELLVIDNYGCDFTKRFVESIPIARYVEATDLVGTAAPRDLVFRRALGKAVVCMDSHVLLESGVVARLKAYYDEHPDSVDLLQGPLVYDDLRTVSTHFEPVWRSQMWGVWETDPRGRDPDGEPFDIPMQGLGVFSCRRQAWPGFNPAFRGFGGEEGYIHEKFRQRGGRTLCLPWLRWVHRFSRPKGVPYPLAVEDKLRNYIIGHTELGLDITPALEHFADFLSPQTIEDTLAAALADLEFAGRSRTPAKTRKRKRGRKDAKPDFDRDMAQALLDAIPDEVRIAYGEAPLAISDFPLAGPERDHAVLESRSILVGQGWLADAEFATLTIDEAIDTALHRARSSAAIGAALAADADAADRATDPEVGAAAQPARSPPAESPSGRRSARTGYHGPRRAIVVFVDDNPNIQQQAMALILSWRYSRCRDTDIVVMGPGRAVAQFPDDVVRIDQQPASYDPVWRGYGYINSIACLNGTGSEALAAYTHLLRSDADTFITPAWNEFRPDAFTVGIGGYCNDDDTRRRIRALADLYGLTHRGLANCGSTWYGPTDVVRRCGAITEMLTKHLITREFADHEGAWPGWYRGVSLLYASEVAVNHCAPDAQRSDLLDGSSTTPESIYVRPHIHCWATEEKFSKHRFMAGGYTPEDAQNLNMRIVRDYCMAHSFASLAELGERR